MRLVTRQLFRKKQDLLTVATRLSSLQLVAQNVQQNDEFLTVQWNDGKVDEFPHFYLRENCSCPKCFQPLKNARNMFPPKELDINVTAEKADIDCNQLNVKWTDGHTSVYSPENLQSLRYVSCHTSIYTLHRGLNHLNCVLYHFTFIGCSISVVTAIFISIYMPGILHVSTLTILTIVSVSIEI